MASRDFRKICSFFLTVCLAAIWQLVSKFSADWHHFLQIFSNKNILFSKYGEYIGFQNYANMEIKRRKPLEKQIQKAGFLSQDRCDAGTGLKH